MSKILRQLSKSHKWWITQTTHALNTTTSLLFTMLLIKEGVGVRDIMLAFTIVYSLAVLPLYCSNYAQITKVMLYLSSCSIIIAFFYKQAIMIVPLTLFAASLQISRDIMFLEILSVYSYLSRKNNVDVKKIIATAMTASMALICIVNPTMGTLLTASPPTYYVLIGLCGVVVANNIPLREYDNSYARTHVKSKCSAGFTCFCVYSFASVVCRYFIRFFTIPLLITTISNRLGVGDYSFTIIGVVAGLAGILSFVTVKNKVTQPNKRTLYISMFSTLVASAAVAIVGTYSNLLSATTSTILFIISYIALEVFSKIFSIHQADELRRYTNTEHSRDSVYASFTKYRIFGGIFGFLTAYTLYNEIYGSVSLFIVCCSAAIMALAAFIQIKVDRR